MSFRLKEGRLIIGLPTPTNDTSIGRLSFYNCYGPTSVTIGNSVTKLVDTAYYTSRHILQYQPTFNIVRYIPLRHVQQKKRFEFYGQEPS